MIWKAFKAKTSKSTSNTQEKYCPNGMQFVSWSEWQHLLIQSCFTLDNIPSSVGILPVNSLRSKTIQNKNIKVNIKPSRKVPPKRHAVCIMRYITYVGIDVLGLISFPALMGYYLPSHSYLKSIQNKISKSISNPQEKYFPKSM